MICNRVLNITAIFYKWWDKKKIKAITDDIRKTKNVHVPSQNTNFTIATEDAVTEMDSKI